MEELKKTEDQIAKMQELIKKLNDEIFKDPQNHIRPPSEYLEVYNRFTASLHYLQQKKENLEQEIKLGNESNEAAAVVAAATVATTYTSQSSKIGTYNNDSDSSLFDSASSTSAMQPATANESGLGDEGSLTASASVGVESTSFSTSPHQSMLSSSLSSRYYECSDTEARKVKSSLPTIKLDHPTTLNTTPFSVQPMAAAAAAVTTSSSSSTSPPLTSKQQQYQQRQQQQQHYKTTTTTTTPTLPIAMSGGHSTSTSPATTPTSYTTMYIRPADFMPPPLPSSSSPPYSYLTTSTSQTSLTQQQYLNGALSYNRSFGEISDAANIVPSPSSMPMSSTTPMAPGSAATSSLSPSASSANTPTTYSNPLPSSSFFRVYIGTSTAVVEKKPIMLKEALYSKLKSRNLEIEKCIAFIKDLNIKIEWDYDVSKLNADQIVVAEIGDEIRHRFEKKTFTLRSCDSCKKRFLLNVYACSKCDYVMCQRNECRARTERIICAPRRVLPESALISTATSSATAKSNLSITKPEFDIFGRPESPIRESSINVSQQILPVNQLKVNIPSRDRSRSETELNMFIHPKLINDASRPVPKSPSTLAKSNTKNAIYGTMPRNNLIKPSTSVVINNGAGNQIMDDISGSVNEESGSVIGSIGKSLAPEQLFKPTNTKLDRIKQNKPNRRDSFNSWEIPFDKIKIDMNKKVGSGSFGIVHQGRDFFHGTVAIKFLNVQNPTPSQAQAFRNEVAILKSLRHDCILLFIGCILKPYLAIVTEWCPGSSLYRHLHVEEEHWDVNQLIEIAKQTAIGMEYLHACNILHRDLKSNNIFLVPKETSGRTGSSAVVGTSRGPAGTGGGDGGGGSGSSAASAARSRLLLNDEFGFEPKWSVKIGDFGLATVKSAAAWNDPAAAAAPQPRANQPTGSILWMAPEVITQRVPDPYTQKSDVYSFAVVLYELFTGLLPYQHKEQNTILFMVGSGRLKPNPDDLREDTPHDLKELMVECSQYDRNKRHDFVQINERLRKIKAIKPKTTNRLLQRSQSLPCLSFIEPSYHSSNIYDPDDFYTPSTPHPDMLSSAASKLNSPSQVISTSKLSNAPKLNFESSFDNESIFPQSTNNIKKLHDDLSSTASSASIINL